MNQISAINSRKVVCIGDSLTQGTFSFNWAKVVSKQVGSHQVQLYNHGRGGELAYSVLQRIDKVVALNPMIVVILIGTNDALAITNSNKAKLYQRHFNLPQIPDLDFFKRNLQEVVVTLKRILNLKIALISVPPLGEKPDSASYRIIENINDIILVVSQDEGVDYLPFYERVITYLDQYPLSGRVGLPHDNWTGIKTSIQRFLLLQSWDRIAQSNGYHLLTDGIHLNSKGGMILTTLVKNYILNTLTPIEEKTKRDAKDNAT